MVNKVTFVGLRGGDRPLDPPLTGCAAKSGWINEQIFVYFL